MLRSQPIAKTDEIPEGQGQRFVLVHEEIAIFKADGCLYAIQHRCPHMGTGLAHGGIENGAVVCPRHQWRWRLSDGKFLEADGTVPDARTYRLQITDEVISVVIHDDDHSAIQADHVQTPEPIAVEGEP